MFGFDDDDFGLDDLIEADIQYGIFEEDNKFVKNQIKYQPNKQKKDRNNFWNIFGNKGGL